MNLFLFLVSCAFIFIEFLFNIILCYFQCLFEICFFIFGQSCINLIIFFNYFNFFILSI